jgi:preprotein translocase subunit YajC
MNTLLLQAQDSTSTLIMMAVMAVVFYFFMIRPQMKRSKEAKAFRENLAVGDKIITSGGIHGKVLEITDTNVLISTESGKLRMEKSSVTMDDKDQLVNQKK